MRFGLVLAIVFVAIVELSTAAPSGKVAGGSGKPGRPNKGNGERGLSKAGKDKLLANCQKKKNKCKGQTDEYKKNRGNVKAALVEDFKARTNASDQEAAAQAEARLNKIHDLKKKVHAKNGLSDIDPADNGVWQKDIILTDAQIEAISKSLDNPRPVLASPADHPKQKRSAAMFFEVSPRQRWNMPIHYWVSSAFSSSDQSAIDAALSAITAATGCIKFAKDSTRLTSGSQIQYVNVGSDGCYGYATVGQWGIQKVNLGTTSWCTGAILTGLIQHETIHALGGYHEQARTDRDDYIQILWENIDPQQWSQFDISQGTTSYGVPYDYQSIMHYEQSTFALQNGLDSMAPYVSTQLGGQSLSSGDVLQLKRMYCRPSTCTDQYPDCGNWAVWEYCNEAEWGSWMKTNCARSCGVC